MPNFFVPHMQQRQCSGGRRGSGPVQQNQQSVPPMIQQQMGPRGCLYRHSPWQNMPEVPIPGEDMRPGFEMAKHVPITALATLLAYSHPDQRRMILGERLYPLVDAIEHDNAAKVTGMFLEMDQTEVLHLLESPDSLKARVVEAMDVLRIIAQKQGANTADQLASLSLNDGLDS